MIRMKSYWHSDHLPEVVRKYVWKSSDMIAARRPRKYTIQREKSGGHLWHVNELAANIHGITFIERPEMKRWTGRISSSYEGRKYAPSLQYFDLNWAVDTDDYYAGGDLLRTDAIMAHRRYRKLYTRQYIGQIVHNLGGRLK